MTTVNTTVVPSVAGGKLTKAEANFRRTEVPPTCHGCVHRDGSTCELVRGLVYRDTVCDLYEPADSGTRDGWLKWDLEHMGWKKGKWGGHSGTPAEQAAGHKWGEAGVAAIEAKHAGGAHDAAWNAKHPPVHLPLPKPSKVWGKDRTAEYMGRDLHAEGVWGPQEGGYGTVIFDNQGRVLLREPKGHFGGVAWSFPKGHADKGEHPVETARRETLEETGLNPSIVGHVEGSYSGSLRRPDRYYLAHVDDSEQHPEFLNGETERLTWAHPHEAEQLLSMSTSPLSRERDLWVLHDAVAAHARLYPNVSTPMPPRTTLTVAPSVSKPHTPKPAPPPKAPTLWAPTGNPKNPKHAELMNQLGELLGGTVAPKGPSGPKMSVADWQKQHGIRSVGTRDWARWDAEHPYQHLPAEHRPAAAALDERVGNALANTHFAENGLLGTASLWVHPPEMHQGGLWSHIVYNAGRGEADRRQLADHMQAHGFHTQVTDSGVAVSGGRDHDGDGDGTDMSRYGEIGGQPRAFVIEPSVTSGTRNWLKWNLEHQAEHQAHAHAWGEAGAAAWKAKHPFTDKAPSDTPELDKAAQASWKGEHPFGRGNWTAADHEVVHSARAAAAKMPAGKKFSGPGPMSTDAFKAHREHVEQQLVAHGSNDLMRSPFSTHISEDRIGGVEGMYHPDRVAQHRQIIDEIMRNAAEVPNDREAVVTAGLGGAGKSTTLRRNAAHEGSVAHKLGIKYASYDEHGHGVGEPTNFLTLNPDNIKEEMARRGMIPEINELSPMERSTFAHEEASHITHQLAQRAMAEGKNHIWDITLNSVRSGDVRVAPLKEAGYRVGGLMVDVSPEHSLQNAFARHLHGQERFNQGQGHGGRFVPSDLILGAKDETGQYLSKNRAAFEAMKQRGTFDRTITVNNEGNAGKIVDETGTGTRSWKEWDLTHPHRRGPHKPRRGAGAGSGSHHPIRAQIDRYAAGEIPWAELHDFLATYDYKTPSHFKPGMGMYDLEDADRNEPGTWGEVQTAHAQGKLSDAEFDRVVRSIASPAPEVGGTRAAPPGMFSANGKLNGWFKWDQEHPHVDNGVHAHTEAGAAWGHGWGEGAKAYWAEHGSQKILSKAQEAQKAGKPIPLPQGHYTEYGKGYALGRTVGHKLAGNSDVPALDSKQISDRSAPLYAAAKKAKDQGDFEEHARLLGAAHGLKDASADKAAWEKANGVTPHEDTPGGKGTKVKASVASIASNAAEAPVKPSVTVATTPGVPTKKASEVVPGDIISGPSKHGVLIPKSVVHAVDTTPQGDKVITAVQHDSGMSQSPMHWAVQADQPLEHHGHIGTQPAAGGHTPNPHPPGSEEHQDWQAAYDFAHEFAQENHYTPHEAQTAAMNWAGKEPSPHFGSLAHSHAGKAGLVAGYLHVAGETPPAKVEPSVAQPISAPTDEAPLPLAHHGAEPTVLEAKHPKLQSWSKWNQEHAQGPGSQWSVSAAQKALDELPGGSPAFEHGSAYVTGHQLGHEVGAKLGMVEHGGLDSKQISDKAAPLYAAAKKARDEAEAKGEGFGVKGGLMEQHAQLLGVAHGFKQAAKERAAAEKAAGVKPHEDVPGGKGKKVAPVAVSPSTATGASTKAANELEVGDIISGVTKQGVEPSDHVTVTKVIHEGHGNTSVYGHHAGSEKFIGTFGPTPASPAQPVVKYHGKGTPAPFSVEEHIAKATAEGLDYNAEYDKAKAKGMQPDAIPEHTHQLMKDTLNGLLEEGGTSKEIATAHAKMLGYGDAARESGSMFPEENLGENDADLQEMVGKLSDMIHGGVSHETPELPGLKNPYAESSGKGLAWQRGHDEALAHASSHSLGPEAAKALASQQEQVAKTAPGGITKAMMEGMAAGYHHHVARLEAAKVEPSVASMSGYGVKLSPGSFAKNVVAGDELPSGHKVTHVGAGGGTSGNKWIHLQGPGGVTHTISAMPDWTVEDLASAYDTKDSGGIPPEKPPSMTLTQAGIMPPQSTPSGLGDHVKITALQAGDVLPSGHKIVSLEPNLAGPANHSKVTVEGPNGTSSHIFYNGGSVNKLVESHEAKVAADKAAAAEGAPQPHAAPLNPGAFGQPKVEHDAAGILPSLDGLTPKKPGETFKFSGEKVPGTGTSGGQWYEDPKTGQAYFLKGWKSDAHSMNEVAGSLAYQLAGVPTQRVTLVKMNDGHVRALAHYVPGLKPITPDSLKLSSSTTGAIHAEARKGFGMDALMSHYDVFGAPGDPGGRNLFRDEQGNVVRLDLGGTGRFRAMGTPKAGPEWSPGDWESNPHSSNSYKTMLTSEQGKLAYGATPPPAETNASLAKAANLDLAKYHQAMLEHGISKEFADSQVAVLEKRQAHLKNNVLLPSEVEAAAQPAVEPSVATTTEPSAPKTVTDVPVTPHVGKQEKLVPAHKLQPGDVMLGKINGGGWHHSQYGVTGKWLVTRVSDATEPTDNFKKVRIRLTELDANDHPTGVTAISVQNAHAYAYRLKYKGAGETKYQGYNYAQFNAIPKSQSFPEGTGVGKGAPPAVAASSSGPQKKLTSVMAKNLKAGDKVMWHNDVYTVQTPMTDASKNLTLVNVGNGVPSVVGGATLQPASKMQKLTPAHPQYSRAPAAPSVTPSVATAIPTVSASEVLSPSVASPTIASHPGAKVQTAAGQFHEPTGSHKGEYDQAWLLAANADGLHVTKETIQEAHKAFAHAPAGSVEEAQLKGVWDGLKRAAAEWEKANQSEIEKKKDLEFVAQVGKTYQGKEGLHVDLSKSATVGSDIPHGVKPAHATQASSTEYDLAIAQGYDQAIAAWKSQGATPENIRAAADAKLAEAAAMSPENDQAILDQAHLAGLAQGAGKAAVDIKKGQTTTYPNASSKSVIQHFKPQQVGGAGSYTSHNNYNAGQSDAQLSLSPQVVSAIQKWKGEYVYSHPGAVCNAIDKMMDGEDPGSSEGAKKAKALVDAYINKGEPNKQKGQRKIKTHGGTSKWAQKFLVEGNEVSIPLTSWSTDPAVWSGDMWLHFPVGTKTLDIGKVGGYTHETETITGGKFRVLKVDKPASPSSSNPIHVYLEQIHPFHPNKSAYEGTPQASYDVGGKAMSQADLQEWLQTLVTSYGTADKPAA